MFANLKTMLGVLIFTTTLLFSPLSQSSGYSTYHVTITNLTNAVLFTPILVASHRGDVSIYELGTAASDDLAAIAEGGDVGPLTTTLNADPRVVDVQNSGGVLMPGESVTVIVKAGHRANRISLASMMLPTNDGFIALNSVRVPRRGNATYFSPGLDAGSEANDELCTNIPGGAECAGVGGSPGSNLGDEGYVHVHRGIHGIGDLAADVYDWRNPVAKISVTRVRGY